MTRTSRVRLLANPVQAADLARIFALTPPARRIPVAAAYLGCGLAVLYDAVGLTARVRDYYARRWKGHDDEDCAFPFVHMRAFAKVIGVPFHALWCEEAIERPARLVRAGFYSPRHTRRAQLKLVVPDDREGFDS